ncbi:MAG: chemotaxis protein CheW [Fimbriimonadaceae bacterium]|nr:chemotaxis protein CheW [Fimbriimonadaceae bacterium]QYK55614.1 MAG: chemotaxis protein CheW [Fimbriimonadaceae bacterium]
MADLIGDVKAEATERQMVVFKMGTEAYGIDIFRVNEIIRMREITPIPRTEEHIRGLINLRGKTIPVVDLRTRLRLASNAETDLTRIIVVETDGGNVGIIVDAVSEVVSISSDTVDETPSLVGDPASDFVRGVAKRGDSLVTLLDLDKALAA